MSPHTCSTHEDGEAKHTRPTAFAMVVMRRRTSGTNPSGRSPLCTLSHDTCGGGIASTDTCGILSGVCELSVEQRVQGSACPSSRRCW